MVEQFLMKCMVGMVIITWPILSGSPECSVSSERFQNYTTTKNVFISAADAAERIMSSCVSVFLYACHAWMYMCG